MIYSDLDLKNNALTLWTRKRKSGVYEPDVIDMSKALKNILSRRLKFCSEEKPWLFSNQQGLQLSKNTIDKIMPRLCEKAKVKPFGLHAIRHHVASQLAMKWPLIHVQKFLRHKRATTTDVYLRSITNIEKIDASMLDSLEDVMKRSRSL